MLTNKDKMVSALKKIVVPELRNRGFKGSFPHFRKKEGQLGYLLSFQFDKWGGGFILEVGVARVNGEGNVIVDGIVRPFQKMNAFHLNNRFRIMNNKNGDKDWFKFDNENKNLEKTEFIRIAKNVLPYLDVAENWFEKIKQKQTVR
ncbi:DUF4304 domain-containing protein [Aeribacillus sp. FSL K6-8210]|uniref:DUF4304 domain-containing protein n=1 Tax=Aeribacillus sp. FSL K6-8210 TaxID=2954683 RepID=UPI0030CF7BAE